MVMVCVTSWESGYLHTNSYKLVDFNEYTIDITEWILYNKHTDFYVETLATPSYAVVMIVIRRYHTISFPITVFIQMFVKGYMECTRKFISNTTHIHTQNWYKHTHECIYRRQLTNTHTHI